MPDDVNPAVNAHESSDNPPDAQLPDLVVPEAIGGNVTFHSELTTLHLSVASPQDGALESGDQLLLIINGQEPEIPVATYDADNPKKTLFTIRYDEPLLHEGTAMNPKENKFQYKTWRPDPGNPNPPVLFSPYYLVWVAVDSDNPPDMT